MRVMMLQILEDGFATGLGFSLSTRAFQSEVACDKDSAYINTFTSNYPQKPLLSSLCAIKNSAACQQYLLADMYRRLLDSPHRIN